ncbi:MAG: tRNA guanosine(34) transglycosylase Tgt [Deltaproteobacteria bacterium]|nr:tRNA guanosine(34) transglycosylase Tgt [Deltaproteobacteria bacterium]
MENFQILHQDQQTQARCGVYKTHHGEFKTPVFMPVGTQATVKSMQPEQLKQLGAQIILSNTYHLYLRPGHQLIKKLGGLHNFMNWQGPILTDSGGYQVFSLAKMQKVTQEGVKFQSHLDGSYHLLTPELAIEVQEALGSDIMMVLDECLPYPSEKNATLKSMEITLNWEERCLQARTRQDCDLFAIVQGGMYTDLRKICTQRLLEIHEKGTQNSLSKFQGFAVGGVSVGEPIELGYEMVACVTPLLPKELPRYVMGVGYPEDIITCIGYGVDMFDCVIPTRCARHGLLFTPQGKLYIRRAEFSEDSKPIDEKCSCYTCQNYSRAYLRHLSLSKEILSAILNTIHNLHYYFNLLEQARLAIIEQRFSEFKKSFFSLYQK